MQQAQSAMPHIKHVELPLETLQTFPAPVHILETGHDVPKRTVYGAALLATALLIIVSKILIALWPRKSLISNLAHKVLKIEHEIKLFAF